MAIIENNIVNLRKRILNGVAQTNRDLQELSLLAVSKTKSAEDIQIAFSCGISSFGENYLQEALEKIAILKPLPIEWHFIGPLQSNKTKPVAENFSWVHSVDRIKIAQRLNDQRPNELEPLNICLQVNVDNEINKSGISIVDAPDLAVAVSQLPNLRLRGLMAIPKSRDNVDSQRQPFRQLRLLKEQINRQLDNSKKLDTLSMGMSGDLEAAIYEGSTILRVGTDVFGKRN
jgi:pyridoxal phosphate enzyme (YggS family)